MIHTKIRLSLFALFLPGLMYAQATRKISLNEALELGVQNSKNIKLSQNSVEKAIANLAMIKDNALPTANASFLYNHAEIPTNQLSIGGNDPVYLPKRADAFVGTAAVEEVIYGGGKLKYAEESTRLLIDAAKLDADKSEEEIKYAVINTYYSLFKVMQSKKVVMQNLDAIASQLKQAQRFFEQGIVTKNDVLRFQLQQANISLTEMEIESNRKVLNYNLDILLGLGESTDLEIEDPETLNNPVNPLRVYIEDALAYRQDLKQADLQNKVAAVNIKSVKANLRPTVGLGANLYYINPSGSFIPPSNQFIMPVTVGANISWNIGALWTNKNKLNNARIEQKDLAIEKEILSDDVKTEINKNYQSYLLARDKIKILETAIAQATENDKLLESKYKNNVASAIDRIDAETLLYQSKINLELAKADAGLAYYTLLKSTGKIPL